jgi:hypothetical protein
LRRDSRPTDCKQSVLSSHPGRRIVWVLRMYENCGAAQIVVACQVSRQICPRKTRDEQILFGSSEGTVTIVFERGPNRRVSPP